MWGLVRWVLSSFLQFLRRLPVVKPVLLRLLSLFPRINELVRFTSVRLGVLPETVVGEADRVGEVILTTEGTIDWEAYPKAVKEIYEELRKNIPQLHR